MADCKKKKFSAIWEAKAWIANNASPYPAPSNVFRCPNCGQFHVTSSPVNGERRIRRNAKKRR